MKIILILLFALLAAKVNSQSDSTAYYRQKFVDAGKQLRDAYYPVVAGIASQAIGGVLIGYGVTSDKQPSGTILLVSGGILAGFGVIGLIWGFVKVSNAGHDLMFVGDKIVYQF